MDYGNVTGDRPGSSRPRTAVGRPPSAAARPMPMRMASAAPGRGRMPLDQMASAVTARPASAQSSRLNAHVAPPVHREAPEPAARQPAPAQSTMRPATSAAMVSTNTRSRARTAAPAGRAAVPQRPMSRAIGGMTAAPMGNHRPITVSQRPVTQQGMAGVRPATTRGLASRQVLDKSYFMGVLRSRTAELNHEITSLSRNNERISEQQQNFSVYEKKAEEMANEIKDLQGKLADYNMVIDKMHTNTQSGDMRDELTQIDFNNNTEQEAVDALFAERREKEELAKQLEMELESEKREAENMLTNMDHSVRDQYESLKEENEQLTEELHLKQQELDQLSQKKSDLEDELAVSPIKQEAMVLHEQLIELEQKKAALLDEMNTEGTPEQQRQRLLQTVKKDNEDMGAMERQITQLHESIDQAREEMRELEDEIEDQAGEKNTKYRELRQKEQQIDEFLDSFDFNRAEEQTRCQQLHHSITSLLNVISANVTQLDKTVISGMASLKQAPITKSSDKLNTADELQNAHLELQEELIKIQENKHRATDELDTLKQKMQEMQAEVDSFHDIDSLKKNSERKQSDLNVEQAELESLIGSARQAANQISADVTRLKSQLNDNDAHAQLSSMEKKLQHLEQNNFVMKDAMLSRRADTDVSGIKTQCMQMVAEINKMHIMLNQSHGTRHNTSVL